MCIVGDACRVQLHCIIVYSAVKTTLCIDANRFAHKYKIALKQIVLVSFRHKDEVKVEVTVKIEV